jgi:hypothetical protein
MLAGQRFSFVVTATDLLPIDVCHRGLRSTGGSETSESVKNKKSFIPHVTVHIPVFALLTRRSRHHDS